MNAEMKKGGFTMTQQRPQPYIYVLKAVLKKDRFLSNLDVELLSVNLYLDNFVDDSDKNVLVY